MLAAGMIAAGRPSRAITADENYTNPPLRARGRHRQQNNLIFVSRGSHSHHLLPSPAHTSCLGRQGNCEGLHTYGCNPPDGHACHGLCGGRLHGIYLWILMAATKCEMNRIYLPPYWSVPGTPVRIYHAPGGTLCTVCYKLLLGSTTVV